MYGLPGSKIQFGTAPAKKKRGRPSHQSKFLEKQHDLFPVELYLAKTIPHLFAPAAAGCASGRPPAGAAGAEDGRAGAPGSPRLLTGGERSIPKTKSKGAKA